MIDLIISSKENQENLENAEKLVNEILQGENIDENLLKKLYPTSEIEEIQKLINDMMGREELDGLTPYKTVNREDNNIFLLKQLAGEDKFVNNLYDLVQNWNMPDVNKLEFLFGKFTKIVYKNFFQFQDLKIERSCDNPYIVHLIGCSSFQGLVKVYDDLVLARDSNLHYYNTLWALHDSPEELIPRIKNKGVLKFGLNGLDNFLKEYIPEEMKKDILGLNNIPKLVLYLIDDKDKKTYSSFQKKLKLLEDKSKDEDIQKPIKRMIQVVKENEYKLANKKEFVEDLKDIFYKEIYLQDLSKNHGLYKAKGMVDLLDNLVGMNALSLRSRRMSPKKVFEWAKFAESMVENGDEFKIDILEMKNLANYYAKKIVIEDLAEPVLRRRYFHSAKNSLITLKEALYENYAQPVNSTSPSK